MSRSFHRGPTEPVGSHSHPQGPLGLQRFPPSPTVAHLRPMAFLGVRLSPPASISSYRGTLGSTLPPLGVTKVALVGASRHDQVQASPIGGYVAPICHPVRSCLPNEPTVFAVGAFLVP
eukprot:9496232-Pyramimonas_sp.AAC.2